MTATRFEYLFNRYYEKTCTTEERTELMNLLNESERDMELKNMIDGVLIKAGPEMELDNDTADAILQSILNANGREQKSAVVRSIKRWSFTRVAAAAVILFLLTVGGYYLSNRSQKEIAKTEETKSLKNDIAAPVNTKATITLADGRIVAVDSLTSLTQGNVNVIKTADGKIIYSGNSNEMIYNTLSNPRGSKVIDMTLADGSHVWLNAGSSVSYPVAFVGKERNVDITGEAYFEIAKNSGMPFKVKVNGAVVEVLGTHFNVNSYSDEASMKVTLLEGSVEVTKGNSSELLKPGQQAILPQSPDNKEIKIINAVDIDGVMAWKNGLFSFSAADLQTVLRELARWYDVDIMYEGVVPKREFEGKMQKDMNLSEVLKILEKNNVHFKIEGKKLIVTP